MLNNGYAAFVWVRAPSLCLLSDTLLNEDALPHRSRREQGAGGHPVLSTGIVCVYVEIGGRDGEGYCRCSIKLGVSVCACEERIRFQLHNAQRRNKHPPHNLPVVSCAHLCNDPVPNVLSGGQVWTFNLQGNRWKWGEVAQSAPGCSFPSAHFSWAIFQEGTEPALVLAVM